MNNEAAKEFIKKMILGSEMITESFSLSLSQLVHLVEDGEDGGSPKFVFTPEDVNKIRDMFEVFYKPMIGRSILNLLYVFLKSSGYNHTHIELKRIDSIEDLERIIKICSMLDIDTSIRYVKELDYVELSLSKQQTETKENQ